MFHFCTCILFVVIWPALACSKETLNSSESDGYWPSSKIPLYIGGLLPFSGGWDASGLVPGIDFALEQVNAREDLLYEYDLKIVWNDTKVSPTSSSPGLSNRVRFPLFYRTRPAEQAFNPARIAIMKEYEWTRVATLHENYELFSLTIDDLVRRLKAANITLISSESFVDNPKNQIESLKKHDAKIIVALMYTDQAQKVFCEAYKLNMTGNGYMWMLVGWYQDKWWEVDFGQLDCTKDQLAKAVGLSNYIGIRSQSLSSTGKVAIGNVTAMEFDEYVKDQLANNPRYSSLTYNFDHPYGYDTLWAIALALNESIEMLKTTNFPDGHRRRLEDFTYDDEKMTMVFFESLARVSFVGITGHVSFEKGDRVGVSIIRQLGEDLLEHKIGDYNPSRFKNALRWSGTIIWPGGKVPLDRTPEVEKPIIIRQLTVGTNTFVLMCSLSGVGILLAMAFLIFNIKFRKQRYVRLSSPSLNNLIIAGGMIMYTGVFFIGVDTQLVSVRIKTICCQLNIWVMSVGFVLSFGSIFSKTWRVYKVASFKTPKRTVITDHVLFKMIAVLLLIDVVILTTWQVIDPMRLVVKQLYTRDDPKSPNQLISPYIELCESDYIVYWMLALYIYKGLLLVFGGFLAWETRKVKIEALNDSKFIGISVYNVIILCTIGVTVSFIIGDDPEALYLFICGIIIFCNTVTLLLIFIPKIISIRKFPEGESISKTIPKSIISSATHASLSTGNLTEEIDTLKGTIAELNKQLRLKEAESCCEMGCLSLRLACLSSAKDHQDNGEMNKNNDNIK